MNMNKRILSVRKEFTHWLGIGTVLLLVAACSPPPGTFATPEDAVKVLSETLGTGDVERIEEIFGPGSMEMFQSGDEEDDRKTVALVKEMLAEEIAFEDIDEHTKVALFGKQAWPLPIPLVRSEERWRFDTEKGREELLNRRIGHNELDVLNSMRAIVVGQREYRSQMRDGNPPTYAQRFRSQAGTHDGLYWPEVEGEDLSPLGDLLADSEVVSSEVALPFQGYHYRMLSAQGASAPGGSKSYIDATGLMTGGFAGIAWPAKYGNSGVMSFLVNHQGIVFQKDLGEDTDKLAADIVAYDPDQSWEPTGDGVWLPEDSAAGE